MVGKVEIEDGCQKETKSRFSSSSLQAATDTATGNWDNAAGEEAKQVFNPITTNGVGW